MLNKFRKDVNRGNEMNVVRSKGAENKDFKPHALVAQKFADAVVFRRFQGEGVEFF